MVKHKQAYQLQTRFKVKNKSKLVVSYKQAIATYSLAKNSPIGAVNEELKIVSQKPEGKPLTIDCEGKPNRNYEPAITNSGLAAKITGAEFEDGRLSVNISKTGNEFIKHKIVISVK